jgi:hypothetical protein
MSPMPAAAEAKLVHMANQIATFFATQAQDEAVTGIETHIRNWRWPRSNGSPADLPRPLAASCSALMPLLGNGRAGLRAAAPT